MKVTEIKGGKRQKVNEKVLPGYILVRMELTDESWGRGAQHSGCDRLRRSLQQAFAAEPAGGRQPARSGAGGAGQAKEAAKVAATVDFESASPSPSWTALRDPAGHRSNEITLTPRSSRCWCRSSVVRPRSSSRSTQVSKI